MTSNHRQSLFSTESEWEYVARGEGQNVTYPWEEVSPTCSYAEMSYNSSYCNGHGTSQVCNTPQGNTP